jgi:hypothetical protein
VRLFAAALLLLGCATPIPSGAQLNNPPPEVRNRAPLPLCGTEVVVHGPGANVLARECFWSAYQNRRPAELISTQTTIEGDPITLVYRTVGDGRVEIFIDSTQDAFGSGAWTRLRCDNFGLAPDAAAIEFLWDECIEESLG